MIVTPPTDELVALLAEASVTQASRSRRVSDLLMKASTTILALQDEITSLRSTSQAGGVPEGWKLVPVEPTEDMWVEGAEFLTQRGYLKAATTATELFRVMLSASPPPPPPAIDTAEIAEMAAICDEFDIDPMEPVREFEKHFAAQTAIDGMRTALARGHVLIDYTNWRGERAVREIVPLSWKLGANEWHPQEQWMVLAHDVEKGVDRWFALSGIHSWGDAALASVPAPQSDEMRKALEKIASCNSHHPDDVVAIARAALASAPTTAEPSGAKDQ